MDRAKDTSRQSDKKHNGTLCVLIGTLWGIACSAMLLLICGGIGLLLDNPDKYVPILSLSVFFISSFVSGNVSAVRSSYGEVRCGICSGLLFCSVIAIIALLSGVKIKIALFAVCVVVALVTAVFGGIAGAGKNGKVPKRRKHNIHRFR